MVKIYQHLKALKGKSQGCPVTSVIRRFKRDYEMANTISEMFSIQGSKLRKVMQRPRFEGLLNEFCSREKVNPLFSDITISDVFTAVSMSASRKSSGISEASPVVLLVKETPNVCMRIFVDQLFKKSPDKRQNYQIVGEHCCIKRNYLTRVSKQVLCSFLHSLGRHSKDVGDYLACIGVDLEGKIYPRRHIREPLSVVMKDVFDLLHNVVIEHSLVFVVQNAEYLDDYFFKAVRRFEGLFPKCVKLVLTVSNDGRGMKGISLLNNALSIHVKNREFIPSFCSFICRKFVSEPDEKVLQALLNSSENNIEKVKTIVNVLIKESDDRKKKIERERALSIILGIKTYGREFKLNKVKAACKKIEGSKNRSLINQVILLLIEAKAPLPVYLLESWLAAVSSPLSALKEFRELFLFSTPSLNPDTIIKLRCKSVWKEVYSSKIASTIKGTINAIVNQCLSNLENEEVIDMHIYYPFNVVSHFVKLQTKQQENPFISFKWLFSQIKTFRSFDQVISDLERMLYFAFDDGVNTLKNHMHILENIYMNKRLQHNEFITQMQSRLLNEQCPSLQKILLDSQAAQTAYLKPSHPALRENANIEHIVETDSELVAAFSTDAHFVYATEQGLMCIHSLSTHELLSQYFFASGVLVLCHAKDDMFLVGGKSDPVFLWRIAGDPARNPGNKLKEHISGAHKIACVNDTFFVVGNNNALYKGTLEPFKIVAKNSLLKAKITNLEAIRVKGGSSEDGRVLVLVGVVTGSIAVLDSDLKEVVCTIEGEKELISICSLRKHEESFASITIDNEISIYDASTLALKKSFSIFRVNQDELKQVFILEEAQVIVSVERRVIRSYKLKKHELIDEWLYMFKADIVLAAKSLDGRRLLVGDRDGRLCVFRLQGELQQRHALCVPSHKKGLNINFILATSSDLDICSYLITCSQEREVKVWSRDSCKFMKKFNLASVASKESVTVEDIITAAAVDKQRKNLLYLGCKDTNLYWVNLGQGLSSEPIAEQYSKLSIEQNSKGDAAEDIEHKQGHNNLRGRQQHLHMEQLIQTASHRIL